MTLNNNMYRTVRTDPEAMTADIRLLPDSIIYNSVREVVNAKFLIVMEPQATPDVRYEFTKITDGTEPGTVKLQAAARSIADNAVMAKLSLILQEQ